MHLLRLQFLRLVVFAMTVLAPVVALAQEQSAPPQPSLKRYAPEWIGYLVVAVLMIVVLAVSLMPSKRGHQD
ncbi:MAG: hypothetical protein GY715_04500 [Planctomycetes bacterium]|nr:hypothetical protein [Planctomycetota bacterium]